MSAACVAGIRTRTEDLRAPKNSESSPEVRKPAAPDELAGTHRVSIGWSQWGMQLCKMRQSRCNVLHLLHQLHR